MTGRRDRAGSPAGAARAVTRTGALGASTVSTALVTAQQVRYAVREPVTRVAFLHGLTENPRCWDRVVPLLPDDVHAWVFGLPWDGAHGQEWALERNPGVWVERALALLPAPRVPTVLVAHSFGANVLLDHLDTRPLTEPLGLVLLAPFFRATRRAVDWPMISYYLNDFHLFLAGGISARRVTRPVDPELLIGMSEKVRDRIGAYGWLRFFELFARTPLLDLAALTMPCVVAGGEHDRASFPDDCRALAAALPNARAEILPGHGHHLMLEAPARVAELIREVEEWRYAAA